MIKRFPLAADALKADAGACKENSDARCGFGDLDHRGGFGCGAGAGANVQSEISGSACRSVSNGGDRFDCRFTSLEQCAESASGGIGQCIANPFYAGAPAGFPNRR